MRKINHWFRLPKVTSFGRCLTGVYRSLFSWPLLNAYISIFWYVQTISLEGKKSYAEVNR